MSAGGRLLAVFAQAQSQVLFPCDSVPRICVVHWTSSPNERVPVTTSICQSGSSWIKQLHLSNLIHELPDWHMDVVTGTLSFGDEVQWTTQILGTESHGNNTWLWAWANTASNLPPALIRASLQMKQFGQQQKISELTEPQLSLSDALNGHVLSMIA